VNAYTAPTDLENMKTLRMILIFTKISLVLSTAKARNIKLGLVRIEIKKYDTIVILNY